MVKDFHERRKEFWEEQKRKSLIIYNELNMMERRRANKVGPAKHSQVYWEYRDTLAWKKLKKLTDEGRPFTLSDIREVYGDQRFYFWGKFRQLRLIEKVGTYLINHTLEIKPRFLRRKKPGWVIVGDELLMEQVRGILRGELVEEDIKKWYGEPKIQHVLSFKAREKYLELADAEEINLMYEAIRREYFNTRSKTFRRKLSRLFPPQTRFLFGKATSIVASMSTQYKRPVWDFIYVRFSKDAELSKLLPTLREEKDEFFFLWWVFSGRLWFTKMKSPVAKGEVSFDPIESELLWLFVMDEKKYESRRAYRRHDVIESYHEAHNALRDMEDGSLV